MFSSLSNWFTFQIFTHPKDKVALFYTENSSKNLHENKSCNDQNNHGWSKMNQVSWEMLEYIKNDFRSTREPITSNWMVCLKTAIDSFKELKWVTNKIMYASFSVFSTSGSKVHPRKFYCSAHFPQKWMLRTLMRWLKTWRNWKSNWLLCMPIYLEFSIQIHRFILNFIAEREIRNSNKVMIW